jgi:prepilin-type N-terminal cleavage/methylation domain-containing protein
VRNKKINSQSGFTLVELLIVIVIIGILAGVVIGILNPVQQQNRARDAAARAQIDKMALSGKSLYVSSPRSSNRSPTPVEFAAGLGNANTTLCTDNTPSSVSAGCAFTINGQNLASTCLTAYNGIGGGLQCSYYYWRSTTAFEIMARGAAKPELMFVYYFNEDPTLGTITEGFWSCPASFGFGDAPNAGAAGCSQIN